MPKELDQNIALAECRRDGWYAWFPKRTWGERDIFGVFDFIAVKKGRIILVQLTTIQHLSDRRKKILSFYDQVGCRVPNAFVWAWDKSKNRWVKERI